MSLPMLKSSAGHFFKPVRKLQTQSLGLRICVTISYRKHLRICGKKIEIYRKSVNQQHYWDRFCNFQKNTFLRFNVSTDLGGCISKVQHLSPIPQLWNDYFLEVLLFLQQNKLA